MEVKQVKTSIPGYRPSLEERETIIRFSEGDVEASVYTFNPALIRKLDRLAEERPEEVHCMDASSINGVENRDYLVPRSWVKVIAPRVLSAESKAALAEQMKLINSRKLASTPR